MALGVLRDLILLSSGRMNSHDPPLDGYARAFISIRRLASKVVLLVVATKVPPRGE